MAGSVMVAPDWDGWKQPGIVNYKSQDTFEDAMSNMLSLSEKETQENYEKSKAYILANLTLDITNKSRMDLLEKMMSEEKVINLRAVKPQEVPGTPIPAPTPVIPYRI